MRYLMRNINCKHNDDHAWCTNKNIKRSLFGIGAGCCKIYPYGKESDCEYNEKFPSPIAPPPSPNNRKRKERIVI